MIWPISIKNEINFNSLNSIMSPIQDYKSLYSFENEEDYINNHPCFLFNTICYTFPVLEGTKYSNRKHERNGDTWNWFVIQPSWIPFIVEYYIIEYNSRCQYLLDNFMTKDMFKEHSLFLLKESLKTFSPYSDKAKELLKKLESLDE